MRVSVRSKGPDLSSVINTQVKALTAGQRKAGQQIGRVGAKAITADTRGRRGTLSFQGKSIGVKTRTQATATGSTVTLSAKPAGAWAIINDGAKAHPIMPHGRALKFGATYAPKVAHPGTSGSGVWEAAEPALDRAVFPIIEDAADAALGD